MQKLSSSRSSERHPVRRRCVALALASGMVALSLVIVGADAAYAVPANDNFPSAQLISGPSGTVSGSNVDATFEHIGTAALRFA